MKIFFIASGSSAWGTGHLVRSLAVMKALQARGQQVTRVALVPLEEDRHMLSPVLSEYHRVMASLQETEIPRDAGLVLDIPSDLQAAALPWLKGDPRQAVALDWYGPDQEWILARANLRGGREALRYAVIRKEFVDERENRDRGVRYDAVIALGGNDIQGHLPGITRVLSQGRPGGGRIAVVRGPLTRWVAPPELSSQPSWDIFTAPEDLARIMATARVGICNAGGTLMEFTALGIPTIVFAQTPAEERFAKTFVEAGCSQLGELDRLLEQVSQMCVDDRTWQRQAQNARALIDGQGAGRIADLIQKAFLTV